MDNVNVNNEVHLAGTIVSALSFSHEVYGERFLTFCLKVPRLSDISDYINVTVSERLIKAMDLSAGTSVEIDGQFRSYNNYSSTGNRLLLTVLRAILRCAPMMILKTRIIFI